MKVDAQRGVRQPGDAEFVAAKAGYQAGDVITLNEAVSSFAALRAPGRYCMPVGSKNQPRSAAA